ncbi:hypothetical protein B5F77_14205 [Parabacteroides sp. An277]|nr:hypothetical protein B5F77_14205 [Parabacteroides sp. An277]
MSASVSCFGSGRNRGRNGCGIYNYLFLGAAEISASLPPIAGSRRDSPQPSRRLQEAGEIFRKPPDDCRKSERFSTNLPTIAGGRRDFPQASRRLQEVGEIFRKPPADCSKSAEIPAGIIYMLQKRFFDVETLQIDIFTPLYSSFFLLDQKEPKNQGLHSSGYKWERSTKISETRASRSNSRDFFTLHAPFASRRFR